MTDELGFFLDATGRLRTFWRMAIFVAGFILIYLFFIIIIIAIIAIAAVTGDVDISSIEHVFDESNIAIVYISSLPPAFILIGFTILCRRYLDRKSIVSMGFQRSGFSIKISVFAGTLVGTVFILFISSVILLFKGFYPEYTIDWQITALLIPLLVIGALAEEIVCRGYIFQNFLDIGRPLTGLVFSSLFFWILHAFNPHVWSSPLIALNLFCGGISLALAYQISGNIWFPTAFHFAWNFTQGGLLGMPISGMDFSETAFIKYIPSKPTWLTGGSFGVEGSLIATMAEIIVILLFAWIIHKSRSKSKLHVRDHAELRIHHDQRRNHDVYQGGDNHVQRPD